MLAARLPQGRKPVKNLVTAPRRRHRRVIWVALVVDDSFVTAIDLVLVPSPNLGLDVVTCCHAVRPSAASWLGSGGGGYVPM